LRYNAALDSLELAATRDALSQAEALQQNTEARLSETVAQVDRCEAREAQLEAALTKASKRGKRWRFIAAVAGVVAVVEGVIIGVATR
jgi:multidrug resistance efflux pump